MAIGSVPSYSAPVRAPMFSFEQKGESRVGAFLGSFLLQSIAVALLLLITIAGPKTIRKIEYNRVDLVMPPAESKVVPPRPHIEPPPAPRIVPPPPRVEQPAIAPPPIPAVKPPVLPTPAPVKVVPAVKPVPAFETPVAKTEAVVRHVETNVFGASDSVSAKRTAGSVMAAGFGNPAGAAPGKGERQAPVYGVFGGVTGGQGEAHSHGTVVSAGFGSGSAVGAGHGSGGRVAQAGFGSVSAPPAPTRRVATEDQGALVPVVVESKPVPVYSDEGRRLHIEGEVLVSVVFTAQGTVKVLGVEKGLGHGLDENAVDAARGIRFRPAKRNGRNVDFAAVLHIVFALS